MGNQAENTRRFILAELLNSAGFDGWNNHALEAASASVGLERNYAYVAFPGGIWDAIEFYHQETVRRLREGLGDLSQLKIRERIAEAVMARLKQAKEHKEALRKLTAYYALPKHMAQGATHLAKTADVIWRLAGDNSSDFSYYTKRLLLSGIYAATLLFWLNDTSENMQATRAFLDRRIAEVMKIPEWKNRLQRMVRMLP